MSDREHQTPEQAGFTGQGFTGEPGAATGGSDGGEYGEFNADPLMVNAPEKKKHTGALVLILVVGLAVGSLFSMHTLTKVTAASGKDTEIERTINEFLGSIDGEPPQGGTDVVEANEEIVNVLENNYVNHQVRELERNPFNPLVGTGGGPTGNSSASQVHRAAAKLDLKMVMGGARPLANINGRTVRLNDEFSVELSKAEGAVTFRVTSITRDSVKVEAVNADLAEPFEAVLRLKRDR